MHLLLHIYIYYSLTIKIKKFVQDEANNFKHLSFVDNKLYTSQLIDFIEKSIKGYASALKFNNVIKKTIYDCVRYHVRIKPLKLMRCRQAGATKLNKKKAYKIPRQRRHIYYY